MKITATPGRCQSTAFAIGRLARGLLSRTALAPLALACGLGTGCVVASPDDGESPTVSTEPGALETLFDRIAVAPSPGGRAALWDQTDDESAEHEGGSSITHGGGGLLGSGGAGSSPSSSGLVGGGGSFRDLSTFPMPFRTPAFSVTRAEVENSFRAGGAVTEFDRVGIRSSAWRDHWATYCHTQGIAVAGDRFFTSCMTKNLVGDQEGFLQVFRRPIASAGSFANGANSSETANVRVYGEPIPHAAVGQAAVGVRVTAPSGHQSARFEGRALVPIVSEGSNQRARAQIDLRGGEGTVRYTFEHTPAPDDPQAGGLACTSLLMMPHEGKPTLYLMALSKTHVYVYRIHWLGGEETWFSHHEQLVGRRAQDLVVGGEKWPPATTGEMAYQSIALVKGSSGRVYMLAGHDQWLDTYEVVTPSSAQLARNHALSPLMFDKIANRRWSGNGSNGLFYEGMAIEKTGAKTFNLWTAPRDYRNVACRAGTSIDVKCTTLWRISKTF